MDKDCSLQDYINLFDTGVSVADLAPDKLLTNKEYIAFKTKAIGAPIKLVSYKKSFKKSLMIRRCLNSIKPINYFG